MQDATPVATPGRSTWIDVARGFAMVLVVGHHTVNLLNAHDLIQGLAYARSHHLDRSVQAIRMPLFFCISGMLAVGVVGRNWRSLWQQRLSLLLWVYVLWFAIAEAFLQLWPDERAPNSYPLTQWFENLAQGRNVLWYLPVLAIFLVFLKLVRRWPVPLVIALAGAISIWVTSAEFFVSSAQYGAMRCFIFFFVGFAFRDRWLALIPRTSIGATVLLCATSLGGAIVLLDTPGWRVWQFILGSIGVYGACALAWHLSRIPLGTVFARMGRATLPIYVCHPIVLWVLITGLIAVFDADRLTDSPYVVPFVLVAIALLVTTWFGRYVDRPGWRMLLQPPRWLRGRAQSLTPEAHV